MPILPKEIYKFNRIFVKTSVTFFADVRNSLNPYTILRDSKIIKTIWKKNKTGRCTLFDIKPTTNYSNQIMWPWNKDRYINQGNRVQKQKPTYMVK